MLSSAFTELWITHLLMTNLIHVYLMLSKFSREVEAAIARAENPESIIYQVSPQHSLPKTVQYLCSFISVRS